MPKLSPDAVPSYRLHKQSGQALVTLNGKDICLGRFSSPESYAKYNRLVAEWLANGRQAPAQGREITIVEVIAAFWRHAETYYRKPDGTPTSEQKNYRDALKPLRRLYSDTAATKFGPLALQGVRDEMIRQGWCRTYINKQVVRIKADFKWAAGNELVPPSVHHGLVTVAGLRSGRSRARETEAVKPVPEDVVELTLAHTSRQVAALARLQLVTGMRPGEVCMMRGVDIDTSGPIWIYRPQSHKTAHHGHDRFVFLGPKAMEIIKPFLKLDANAYLFSPADAEAERRAAIAMRRVTAPCCGNRIGSHRKRKPKKTPGAYYPVTSYAHAIHNACRLAEQKALADNPRIPPEHAIVTRWHPHQLRHTAATRIRKDYGLEAAQVILGHKTLTVTQVYVEKNIAVARQIVSHAG